MAFRFGFANDVDVDDNAEDGHGASLAPSALEETSAPPVKEHGLKELVG